MRLLKQLGRNLSEVHNLCLATLLVNFIVVDADAAAVLLVGEIVVEIVAPLSLHPELLVPEDQIYPLANCL